MPSLDFSEIELVRLITHQVGSKYEEEGFNLSELTSSFSEDTLEYLIGYFTQGFKPEEFYQFNHPVGLEMNEIYTLVKGLFSGHLDFVENSQDIARLLYDASSHPMIKPGELNVGYFSRIALDGSSVEAIGIFKSETDAPFLKMIPAEQSFLIQHDFGFEIKGIDKGCIIFNTDESAGYKLLIIDKTNKSSEAQYWSQDFLQIKPCSDKYHNTKEFLNITKNFLTGQLEEEFEISKTDKIDYLNRSVDYFKTHEDFDKENFEQEVFQDEGVIDSFRRFDQGFRQDNDIDVADSFEISAQAVKRQARIFKSVLKLDKNFHVYIHGDKSLIERGVENDGRKYYKIYYDREE